MIVTSDSTCDSVYEHQWSSLHFWVLLMPQPAVQTTGDFIYCFANIDRLFVLCLEAICVNAITTCPLIGWVDRAAWTLSIRPNACLI